MDGHTFTIGVLLYGDYPHLAQRCLRSIRRVFGSTPVELRIGCNVISAATRREATSALAGWSTADTRVVDSRGNIHKYPMLRRLFRNPNDPITSPWVMWFDDDSFLRPAATAEWVLQLQTWLQTEQVDMAGSLYTMRLTPGQRAWIEDQPWYTGQPIPPVIRFATGGWWCLRSELLERYDWPVPVLDHRGGDVMLGALCQQQSLRLRHWNHQVGINADAAGHESQSPRRGFDQPPVGRDYQRPASASPGIIDLDV